MSQKRSGAHDSVRRILWRIETPVTLEVAETAALSPKVCTFYVLVESGFVRDSIEDDGPEFQDANGVTEAENKLNVVFHDNDSTVMYVPVFPNQLAHDLAVLRFET